jgi:hypothetical protein
MAGPAGSAVPVVSADWGAELSGPQAARNMANAEAMKILIMMNYLFSGMILAGAAV